jgi:hypothetical protein
VVAAEREKEVKVGPLASRTSELRALASELFQKPVDVTAQGDD